jgi:DNA-binding cell septation regulator SpoVG
MTLPCPLCTEPEIHDVSVTLAGPDDVRSGLCGWASAIVGHLRIDGIAIRRTEAGDFRITMPARKDGAGKLHAIVMPIEPALLRRIEAVVLAEYCSARTRAGWRATS